MAVAVEITSVKDIYLPLCLVCLCLLLPLLFAMAIQLSVQKLELAG